MSIIGSVLAGVVAVGLPGLRLELSTTQSNVLVGEPLRVSVTWRAESAVRGVALELSDRLYQDSVAFIMSQGTEHRNYRETARGVYDDLVMTRTDMAAGAVHTCKLVLFSGTTADKDMQRLRQPTVPFPKRGRFLLRAVYVHDSATHVISNPVTIDVEEPVGLDRDLLAAITAQPDILERGAYASEYAALAAKHRGSRYLNMSRLQGLSIRMNNAGDGIDPDTLELLRRTPERWQAKREEEARRLAEEVLAGDWRSFWDEALDLAERHTVWISDPALKERILQEKARRLSTTTTDDRRP